MNTRIFTAFLLTLLMVGVSFMALVEAGNGGSDPNDDDSDQRSEDWLVLSGTVVDTEGDPVMATLEAFAPEGNSEWAWARSDEGGNYRMDLKMGDYEIKVSAQGFLSQNLRLTIEADTIRDLEMEAVPARDAVLQLTLEGPAQAISVLKDMARNQWLDSQWVHEGFVELTGWAGELELELHPYDQGYLIHRQSVTLTSGETTQLTVVMVPYVESATLTGQVTDDSGAAVEEALVSVTHADSNGYRNSAYSDEEGYYELQLVPGTYGIFASAAGHHHLRTEVALLITEAGPNVHDITLVAKDQVNQPGIVVDQEGQPVAGAEVTAWYYIYTYKGCPECDYLDGTSSNGANGFAPPQSGEQHKVVVDQTTSGTDGRFSLQLPAEESFMVDATAEGLQGDPVWVTTWNPDYQYFAPPQEVRLVLYPVPDVELSGTVTLPDGTYAAGAYLSFYREYRPPNQPYWLEGIWHHSDIEGGCWYVESEEGKKYEIFQTSSNTPLEKVEGNKVALLVQDHEAASYCQIGQTVIVLEHPATRDNGANPADPNSGTDANYEPYYFDWNHQLTGGSTSTDENGAYALELYEGTYELTVRYYSGDVRAMEDVEQGWGTDNSATGYLGPPLRAPELYRYEATVTLEPGQTVLDIQLEKVEDDAMIQGQVTFSDGSDVGERTITVSVNGPDYYNSAIVNGEGAWEIALPHGQVYSYTIYCEDPLVGSVWGKVEVGQKGSTATVTDELQVTTFDSTLMGTVVLDGDPVAGAMVTLWGLGIGNSVPGYPTTEAPSTDPVSYGSDQTNTNYDQAVAGQGVPQREGAIKEGDDTIAMCMPEPYWGPTFTRTVTTDSEGRFSFQVQGGRLYSLGASNWDNTRNELPDENTREGLPNGAVTSSIAPYVAFRHVYVDLDTTVTVELELMEVLTDLTMGGVWWETTDNVPRTLDLTDEAYDGTSWRDIQPGSAADALSGEFPFQVTVTWPTKGNTVEAQILDAEGIPAIGLTVFIFRDDVEYAQAMTMSDGSVSLDLGETAGHDYVFEARAGDEVMAYSAVEGQGEASNIDGGNVLPGLGSISLIALLGVVGFVLNRRRD